MKALKKIAVAILAVIGAAALILVCSETSSGTSSWMNLASAAVLVLCSAGLDRLGALGSRK